MEGAPQSYLIGTGFLIQSDLNLEYAKDPRALMNLPKEYFQSKVPHLPLKTCCVPQSPVFKSVLVGMIHSNHIQNHVEEYKS